MGLLLKMLLSDLYHYLIDIKNRFKKSIKLILILKGKKEIKLQIGSGANNFEHWINTDIGQLNVLKPKNWAVYFRSKKISSILAEHVWEHLSLAEARIANKLCFQYLEKGGRLRLAVPDGFFPDKKYIDYVKPGGFGMGSDDHKILYDYHLIKKELENVGFEVKVLEHWDEHGSFHFVDWSDDYGRINRSRRYDKRNKEGKLVYTSLIVDAIKLI